MPRYVKISLAVLAFALVASVSTFAQESRAEMKAPVSRAEAQKIAVDSVVDGRVVESDFHNRWFRDDDYSFVVVNNIDRFNIRVDASTGEIIRSSHEPIFRDMLADYRDTGFLAPAVTAGRLAADRAANTARVAETRAEAAVDDAVTSARQAADRALMPGRPPVVAVAITPERARSIAADRVPNAFVVDMIRIMDGDRAVYNIELMGDARQINMQIDGTSGKILSYEEKLLDRKDRVNQNVNRAAAATNQTL